MHKRVRRFRDLRTKKLWDVGEYCLEEIVGRSEEDHLPGKHKYNYGEAYIEEFLSQQGFAFGPSYLEVRGPAYHINFWTEDPMDRPMDDDVCEWHQDAEGDARYLAIWASILPTELRVVKTKKEVVLESKHLYIFDNRHFEHRMPAGTKQKRWFIRYYLYPLEL